MFLNIYIDLIILKTHDQQFTLTTKKSLHIIFKVSWLQTGPKLVTDRSEAGRRPAASWNLAYHLSR